MVWATGLSSWAVIIPFLFWLLMTRSVGKIAYISWMTIVECTTCQVAMIRESMILTVAKWNLVLRIRSLVMHILYLFGLDQVYVNQNIYLLVSRFTSCLFVKVIFISRFEHALQIILVGFRANGFVFAL